MNFGLFPASYGGLPTSYTLKVTFHNGSSKTYTLCEHGVITTANALLFITTEDREVWVPFAAIQEVEFDNNWTRIKDHKANLQKLQEAPVGAKNEQ